MDIPGSCYNLFSLSENGMTEITVEPWTLDKNEYTFSVMSHLFNNHFSKLQSVPIFQMNWQKLVTEDDG